jgi:serine/threonine protein phosphatase PrpC
MSQHTEPTTSTLRQAFVHANQEIKLINQQHVPEPDYLINDYFACVAVAAVISGNTLYWGQIGDCGLAVYDTHLNLKFRAANGLDDLKERGIPSIPTTIVGAERRRAIRRDFRNKPDRSGAYGALTGEPEAEHFMQFGHLDLQSGDLILLYSDGFQQAIDSNDFIRFVADNFDSDSKIIEYSKRFSEDERTLVRFRYKEDQHA